MRLEIDDVDGGRLSLPLTDLRFHRPDGKVESRRVQVLSTLLGRGEAMVISVGLAREFEGSHWLQANNVHFEHGFVEHAALNK